MALTSRGFYDNDVTRKAETRGGVFVNNTPSFVKVMMI